MVLSTFYMFVDGTICVAWRFLVFVFETVLGQFWGIECDSRTKSIVVDEEESVRLLDESDGKVAIVTGANTGLGEKTALHLVRRGISVVVLACRSKDRAEEARARIMEELGPNLNKKSTIEISLLDLSDLESVRKFAADFLKRHKGRLDVLVNNAGVPPIQGKTKQGYNLVFGVNFLGHWLLTNLLFTSLCETPHSRVVNLSSVTHYYANPAELEEEALNMNLSSNSGTNNYCLSKLAMVLLTVELRRRFQSENVTATSIAVNPGAVNSDIWRYMKPYMRSFLPVFEFLLIPFLTPEQGCTPTVAAATLPLEDIGCSTIYLQPYLLPYGVTAIFEILGVYIGWGKAQPALPRDYKLRATALWDTCAALLT